MRNEAKQGTKVDRRSFLGTALAGAAAAASAVAGQRDWSGKNPIHYPDPDIISLDKRFNKYRVKSTPIRAPVHRLALGRGARMERRRALPGVQLHPQYHRQMRWLEEDGHDREFHNPSNNANGNTFDWEGRLLTCEHNTRRVRPL